MFQRVELKAPDGCPPNPIGFNTIRVQAKLLMLRRLNVDESKMLGILCVPLLCGILVAGLWPFHSPHNDVSWIEGRNRVQVGPHGILLSSRTFGTISAESSPFTIEIWIQAHNVHDASTLLAFYQSDSVRRFSMRQDDGLELRYELRDGQHLTGSYRTYVDNIFRQDVPAFVTVTAGPHGTTVYLDGVLVKNSPSLRLSTSALTGRLVLGTSPIENDHWSGQLLGLALFSQELTGAQVLGHYQTWTRTGRPAIAPVERNAALYLFGEHIGRTVHDSSSAGVSLEIPERYLILREKFLEPFWLEFNLKWTFWKSALINVGGFIPFGFLYCAYLSSARRVGRPTVITIILGAIVSLTIEVLHSYLPTRDSGTTDLITNTLGTALGAMLFRWKPSVVASTLNYILWAGIPRGGAAHRGEDNSDSVR
jgi:hypothetical protein